MATSSITPTKPFTTDLSVEARQKAIKSTLASMENVISTSQLTYLSNRSIAEVEALQEEVSAVIPAGNIVGLIMGGLARLRDRTLPRSKAESDVSALMRALDMLPHNILPKTVYGTLFVGPAAVLAAYQKLLMLTGKDPESAFPDGLWQFYLEFALREDNARHTTETRGFQKALSDYSLDVSAADQLAAWVCAVSHAYFQYDDWLHNEWRERVYLYLIEEAVAQAQLDHKLPFRRLPKAWAAQRPYHRRQDAQPDETYAAYRHRRFDAFLQTRLKLLPEAQQRWIEATYHHRTLAELPAFQQQMSILATLDPDQYREHKRLIPLWQVRIGIILKDRYYLLPACHTDQLGNPVLFKTQRHDSQFLALQIASDGSLCHPDGYSLRVDRTGRIFRADNEQPAGFLRPASFQAIRRQILTIFEHAECTESSSSTGLDDQLVAIKRTDQERARKLLSSPLGRQEVQAIKYAPVIINWDKRDSSLPLAYIRRGKRGIGDHPLTIFRTPDSMIFDQSHIFLDGLGGMALAETLTGEAISWAGYFSTLPHPKPAPGLPYHLNFAHEEALDKFVNVSTVEVSAENDGINMRNLAVLRKLLPKRHPDLRLTVNDMLVLYRCAFGHEYQPSSDLEEALAELRRQNSPNTQEIYRSLNNLLAKARAVNPSLVIPMEASAALPRERLYPTTFRNPFTELWSHYQHTCDSLEFYRDCQTQHCWSNFSAARRALLAQLNYFGQIMRAYRKVALQGGSPSTAAMKLLAHLPNSLLKLLDEIPQRVDILNEVLKGEEVLSNVGRVARGSSLTRFISAKDDSHNKTLVWAVITDDNDVLHLSLRDFRPHVAALAKIDRLALAEMIAQNYVDTYVVGFNRFVKNLSSILNANATHSIPEIVE